MQNRIRKTSVMIRNENILCVSNTTWEGPYTKSTVQIISRLALENKVLFIEYPFTVKDLILGLLNKKDTPAMRMLGIRKRLETKRTPVGSIVYTWVGYPVLPSEISGNKTICKIINMVNGIIYRISVKQALRQLNMRNIINVNAYNSTIGIELIGKLKEKTNIYYCYDGILPHQLNKVYTDILFSQKADAVIVSSEYLSKQKMQLNRRVFTVKNGVDLENFSKAAKTGPNQSIIKKVGYIGSIDQRFDIEKVEYTIQQLPDFQFEFIGDPRNREAVDRLCQYSNVTILNPVPPEKVPEILSTCDIGIIPYLANEINRNIYPLKINEYLAVGTPVVITRFAELPEFDELITVADTKEEFCRGIIAGIESDNSEQVYRRKTFAANNSWDNRARQFSDAIETVISGKSPRL